MTSIRSVSTLHRVGHAPCSAHQHGFSLVELLVATALAGVLIAGLGGISGLVATIQDDVQDRNE
ncbi:MAG: prepilin-type N-terminal cleavage/methylation domain-containing protein, partial [Gammaproteobacteria bacterium]